MIKYVIKQNSLTEIVIGAPNDTQHQNNANPKNSPIDCDGVLLTNAQCHMVPTSIIESIKTTSMEGVSTGVLEK